MGWPYNQGGGNPVMQPESATLFDAATKADVTLACQVRIAVWCTVVVHCSQ